MWVVYSPVSQAFDPADCACACDWQLSLRARTQFTDATSFAQVADISPAELNAMQQSQEPFSLVDVRQADEQQVPVSCSALVAWAEQSRD